MYDNIKEIYANKGCIIISYKKVHTVQKNKRS